jgi:chorismate mutase
MDTFSQEYSPRPYKSGIITDLIELDRELMKLLVRRAKLVGKLRGGKEHAATPAAARAEKEVRTAWEKNAVSFSRDDKFARQLFSLLQEIRMDSRADIEGRAAYNLSPARRPVNVNIPGPLSISATQMFAVLAAALGGEMTLNNVMLNDPTMDTVKALNSAGAGFTWTVGSRLGDGVLTHAAGSRQFNMATDKALYIGEEIFTAYLMAFLAAGRTGKARFAGGSGLKMADLSPLRRFLPVLGARFGHSVPKSNGLPGGVEASGIIPDDMALPADLPREGVMALFCVAASWKKVVKIDCGALPLPLFTSAFAECLPVLRSCGVADGIQGTVVTIDATSVKIPGEPVCPMYPLLVSYLLALPVFAGGRVSLSGEWDATSPCAQEALALLAGEGVAVATDGTGIHASLDGTKTGAVGTRDFSSLGERFVPLALAFAAHNVLRAKGEIPMPSLPAGTDMALAETFLAHVGVAVRGDMLMPAPGESGKTPWTSPAPVWSFAYALCAYDTPNIGLTNHTAVTALMPSFWALFNSLPDPSEKKEPVKQETTRRRIISRSDAE